MEYSELQGICAKAIKYGLCLGCQQLENPYFRGVKKCKYVTDVEGKQIKLDLGKENAKG
nr:MAG TPA: hypothetical protein [Caudoviricetes sp.]